MMVFGCIGRNCLGDEIKALYPGIWADIARKICLIFILLRGGLELKFKRIGRLVGFLIFIPCTIEAICAALCTRWLF